MAAVNPLRGEATLEAGERGTLKICFDANAFCAAEERLEKTTDQIVDLVATDFSGWQKEKLAKGENPRLNSSLTRTLLWAGLQKHQPGTHMIEAGEIFSDAGPAATAIAVLNAFFAAFGPAEDKEDARPPRPRKAKAGTG